MKTRKELVRALSQHIPFDSSEAAMLAQMLQFLTHTPKAYQRENLAGHVTASAWIVNEPFDQVLLLHHAKLEKWLQPGGHADGSEDLVEVVKKEVLEETGLTLINEPRLFDIDIHSIPARSEVPEHFHYDVRFIVVVPENLAIQRNEESKELAWFGLDKAGTMNNEPSIMRMVNRTLQLLRK